ncbi:unnamed protein product [Phytophthora fragariaefolia]|uniref:Unnamed protein product n=1 Tax=Phytophthora fragariaefolia TaxID=1490495 RepID=A0A9W6YPP3_9STRA|nr:unnamed protein product [Phytophthora fragariaefolia]
MGVVCQPIEHPDAAPREVSPELAPVAAMQSWSRKLQPPATSTCVPSSAESSVELALKFAVKRALRAHASLAYRALLPHRFALACPLLALQDSVGSDSDMCWLLPSGKRKQLQVSAVHHRQQARKRWASVVTAPRRGIKRQRVAVDCSYQSSSWDSQQTAHASVGSPRSLQYALPGLSSRDTLQVLHAMHAMPSELRHLNGSASRSHLRRRSRVRQVFGWRHLLCQEDDNENSSSRVVWKSAKAVECTRMRPLARQIWKASTEATSRLADGSVGQVLYTVNNIARVVHSTKLQYGSRRRARDQVWLECYLDDGLQVCVARKELRQFSEYRAPETSVSECQGFLVRPVYTRAINSRLAGCSLQCLRAVDARDCEARSAPALKQQLIDDLPQLTLQWEEDYLYDLVQAPQVLLESVFA